MKKKTFLSALAGVGLLCTIQLVVVQAALSPKSERDAVKQSASAAQLEKNRAKRALSHGTVQRSGYKNLKGAGMNDALLREFSHLLAGYPAKHGSAFDLSDLEKSFGGWESQIAPGDIVSTFDENDGNGHWGHPGSGAGGQLTGGGFSTPRRNEPTPTPLYYYLAGGQGSPAGPGDTNPPGFIYIEPIAPPAQQPVPLPASLYFLGTAAVCSLLFSKKGNKTPRNVAFRFNRQSADAAQHFFS